MNKFDLWQKKSFSFVNQDQFLWLTENAYVAKKEKELLELILREKPKRILEVGCGEGANLVNLEKLGFRGELVGVDYAKEKIDFAKKKLPQVKLYEANAYNLPFSNNYFDLVFCKNLLHHLNNDGKALEEMVRVCCRQGKIFIYEGNGENLVTKVYACLFKHEVKMKESTVELLKTKIKNIKNLQIKAVFFKEPVVFFRFLVHYRFGLKGLAVFRGLFFTGERFFSFFVPQNYFGQLIIKCQKSK